MSKRTSFEDGDMVKLTDGSTWEVTAKLPDGRYKCRTFIEKEFSFDELTECEAPTLTAKELNDGSLLVEVVE